MSGVAVIPIAEVEALACAMPGSPPPEVLFGVGGGSGFGRFAYGPEVTLLTRLVTRETPKEGFLASICRRLGAAFQMGSASGPEPLRKVLVRALGAGHLPVVWVHAELLPWPGPPAAYHAVAVLDIEATEATVFDGQDRRVPIDSLAAAAGAVPGGARYRTLVVEGPPVPPDGLRASLEAGLDAHTRQMREGLEFGPVGTRSSFGLPGLSRWMAFVEQDGPAGQTLAAQILRRGGGPAMREAQAAFLDHIERPAAADAAREAAGFWAELAEALASARPSRDHVERVRDAEARVLDNQ